MKNNLIFLNEDNLNDDVYRVFSFTRLLELFEEKELVLVNPKKWDDPFENFILKSIGELPDGTEFTIDSRDSFYGQCWSSTKESDAMWRIYSSDKSGVKIRTTIKKLFEPLYNSVNSHNGFNGEYNLSTFIGKVKYSSTKKLIEMLNDTDGMSSKLFDQSGKGQASTFFYKRWAFRHENEIRIIYNDNNRNNNSDLHKIKINPNKLIDEIVFDPRIDNKLYEVYKNHLISIGFTGKIIKSGLYGIKKLKFKVNGI